MVVGFVCRQSLAGKDFQVAYTGLTPGLQFSMFYCKLSPLGSRPHIP